MTAAAASQPSAAANAPSDPARIRSQREVFGETLAAMAFERDDVVVLDGDLANSTRADIVAERAPHAFIEAGIAEQNMFGVAAGMATMGLVPYISTFACFAVARALDQIRVTIAQPHLGVKIVGGYSGILTGSTGKTHQMVDDLAVMRAMPGITVLAPADDVEAEAMLRAAADLSGPVYLRLARDPVRRVFETRDPDLTQPVVLRTGGEVLLVSTGTQTARTTEAAGTLAAAGLDIGHVHVPMLKPLASGALARLIADARLVVTVEEHSIIGGLGGAVAEILAEHGGGPPLRRLGLPDVFGESGSNGALLDKYDLSPGGVATRVAAWAGEAL